MSAPTFSDSDHRLYAVLDRCRRAQLPVTFCGDDPTRKWELIARLEAQLRDTSAPAMTGCDARIVVLPDEA